jgi:hypothetical protein
MVSCFELERVEKGDCSKTVVVLSTIPKVMLRFNVLPSCSARDCTTCPYTRFAPTPSISDMT